MGYQQHGWRHHPTKGTDPIEMTAGGVLLPPPFQPVPLMALYPSAHFADATFNWGPKTDSAAIGGAVFSNSVHGAPNGAAHTPAVNDYFTAPVMLGPKGSAWVLFGNWKMQSNGGQFKISLASITDTDGQLEDSTDAGITYVDTLAGGGYLDDTYQGAPSYDGGSLVFSQSLVIGGDDGDPFTAVTGTDPDTGFPIIDGGAGVYRWKLEVTGKNASSSGYAVDLMNLTWARADALGLI